jgi:hypothetical protein
MYQLSFFGRRVADQRQRQREMEAEVSPTFNGPRIEERKQKRKNWKKIKGNSKAPSTSRSKTPVKLNTVISARSQ